MKQLATTPAGLVDDLIKVEGGYVNNPNDSGGETNFGITKAVAISHGYTGPMKEMPKSVAERIYLQDYWLGVNFDAVAKESWIVAAEMFDTGANAGQGTAVIFLQRALNVLYGTTLKLDGAMSIGGATLTTLHRIHTENHTGHDDQVLYKLLNVFQGEKYAELVEKNVKNRNFIFGWLDNRVDGA